MGSHESEPEQCCPIPYNAQRICCVIDGGELSPDEACRLMSDLLRFERNLSLPDRSTLHRRTIFWFKADADKVLRRVWGLALAMNKHGLSAEFLKTRRPDYIVYEVDQQVTAIPFRDTFRTCKLRRRPGGLKATQAVGY
jgi:hypothetical protein